MQISRVRINIVNAYWNRTRRHDLANPDAVDTSVYITHVCHNPKLSLLQQLVLFALHSSLYWRRNCRQKKDNKDIQKEERPNFRKILGPKYTDELTYRLGSNDEIEEYTGMRKI